MFEDLSLIFILDITGILGFAFSGALVATRKQLDIFGILIAAALTGIGGGFIRDILIGDIPPASLLQWEYLSTPVVAALVVFFFQHLVDRLSMLVNIFDAIGLALFSVTSAVKAVEFGLGVFPAALLGVVGGVGGGMIRDALTNRVPMVFSGELYAFPAMVAASWAALTYTLGWNIWLIALPGAIACFTWRMVALARNWQAPRAREPRRDK